MKTLLRGGMVVSGQGTQRADVLVEGERILVRDCSNYSGLGPGWFRIGVRTEEENERLLTAVARQLGRD